MSEKSEIKPDYYQVANGKDLLNLFSEGLLSREEMIGFCKGCIIKYTKRFNEKNGLEDLRKAKEYISRLEELYEIEARKTGKYYKFTDPDALVKANSESEAIELYREAYGLNRHEPVRYMPNIGLASASITLMKNIMADSDRPEKVTIFENGPIKYLESQPNRVILTGEEFQ